MSYSNSKRVSVADPQPKAIGSLRFRPTHRIESAIASLSNPHPQQVLRAEDAAYRYLAHSASQGCLQTVASFDASFRETVSQSELRQAVRSRFGVDIGFTAEREGFSSMLTVRLLAQLSHAAAQAVIDDVVPYFKSMHWQHRYRMFFPAGIFAADTDCSATALVGLYEAGELSPAELVQGAAELLRSAAPESLSPEQNLDADSGSTSGALHAGVVMVYWEDGAEPGVRPRGKKHDPAVACNVLYALKLAAAAGLSDPHGVIQQTTAYVARHLFSGDYRSGTRYYPSPDTFLYYVAQLCARFRDCQELLGSTLRWALLGRNRSAARPGSPDDPASALNLAQRILAAKLIRSELGQTSQQRALLKLQEPSGAWAPSPLFSLGKRAVYFGSAAITTVFALAALR